MIIRENDKQAIIDIAKETIKQPCRVLAFGSRVNGDAHDTSDLDLVIVSNSKKKIDIDEFMRFEDKLKESNIPIIVQVLDWYRIPESFHKNILSNCEVLAAIENKE